MKAITIGACLAAPVLADVYMHNPPGNNDRNRERNDNRNNGNRLFDSQNNAKGGYPWRGDPTNRGRPDPISYWVGSELDVQWTQQHGSGENPTTYSQMIIQYSCDDQMVGMRDGYPTGATQTQANGNGNNDDNNQSPQYLERVFNNAGQNQDGTNRIPDNEQAAGCIRDEAEGSIFDVLQQRKKGNCDACSRSDGTYQACEFGMNENYYRYNQDCDNRQRNKGLYTADRKLNRNDARSTRQNPNGARSGLECPEERDYYPYWHPTQWIDVAVLTSDTSWCEYYQQESQNVKAKYMCDISEDQEAPITEQECVTAGGSWVRLPSWQEHYAPETKIGPPECLIAPTAPQNHLGFTEDGADYTTYKWTIPDMPGKTCVLRLRYNISTTDYPSMAGFSVKSVQSSNGADQDPMNADAVSDTEIFDSRYNCPYLESNTQDGNDVDTATNSRTGSTGADAFDCYKGLNTLTRPRYNRPEVNPFGPEEPAISIALNTDQSGRTFQDRSFVFRIEEPPRGTSGKRLLNLNVLGKRGNIVQAYPAVEYAFVPHNMTVSKDTVVNVQFHGSDFNNEKNPNNGEGWKYSDRSNLMEVLDAAHSFPGFYKISADEDAPAGVKPTFFTDMEEAKKFAFLDQEERLRNEGDEFECKTEDEVDDEQNDPRLCGKLNYAPNTFQYTLDMSTRREGTYEFISTRNNNFSNRDQKMTLTVAGGGNSNLFGISPEAAQAGGIAAGVIFGIIALVAVVVVIIFVLKRNDGDDQHSQSSGKV